MNDKLWHGLAGLFIALLFNIVISNICYASGFHDLQNTMGEDKIAHAAVSYVICDQLERNCGFNKFWAAIATLAIGAAKETLIDDYWDGGDFAADCAGVVFYQVKF